MRVEKGCELRWSASRDECELTRSESREGVRVEKECEERRSARREGQVEKECE